MNGYIIKTLVFRQSMPQTCEEFIQAIRDDFKKAKNLYDALAETEYMLECAKDYSHKKELAIADITKYVNNRFKKQETKNSWFNKMLEDWESKYKCYIHKDEFSSFIWNVSPWSNGGGSIINNNTSDYVLEYIFNKSKNNKYYKAATGWHVVIKTTGNSNKRIGYPTIILDLDDKMKSQWEADKNHLKESIDAFYKDTNYWGD